MLNHQVVPHSILFIYAHVRHIEEVTISRFDAPWVKRNDSLPTQSAVCNNGPSERSRRRDSCNMDSRRQTHSPHPTAA